MMWIWFGLLIGALLKWMSGFLPIFFGPVILVVSVIIGTMDTHLGLVKDMSEFVTGMDAKLVMSIFFVPMVFESIYQVD
jgi:hypothetical protein